MHMLTDDLSHISILTWIDEELTTILQFVDRIGKSITSIH